MKHYEDIARHIEAHADGLPETTDTTERTVVIQYGNLTLRCRPSRAAVLALAEKYRKAKALRLTPRGSKPAGTARRFNQQTLDQFLRDGEIDNALEYAKAHGRCVYFTDRGHPILQARVLDDDSRFVIGCVQSHSVPVWSVTFISNGQAAVQGCKTKAEALAAFRKLDRRNLEDAIAKAEAALS